MALSNRCRWGCRGLRPCAEKCDEVGWSGRDASGLPGAWRRLSEAFPCASDGLEGKSRPPGMALEGAGTVDSASVMLSSVLK
jgi:hypothetical protein